jgi:hypothetical protein
MNIERVIAYIDGFNLYFGRGSFVKSQFPDRIGKPDGIILEKPLEWR